MLAWGADVVRAQAKQACAEKKNFNEVMAFNKAASDGQFSNGAGCCGAGLQDRTTY